MIAVRQPPTIVWVVGTATGVGKTTIALALLRYLNGRGIPALGFKPVAGSRLRKHVDFALANYPVIPARLFGRDSLNLARASPLTTDADVDLITPWQLLFHRTSDDTLLLRTGSAQLDNVQFFTTDAARKLMTRPDLARMARMLNLPLESARVFDPQSESRMKLAPDVQKQAFTALLERHPEVIVVEAAGPFLPTWKDAPPVRHVVAVRDDEIVLYAEANVQVPHKDTINSYSFARPLLGALTQRGIAMHSVTQCIVESTERDAAMEQLVARLLAKAGLQAGGRVTP